MDRVYAMWMVLRINVVWSTWGDLMQAAMDWGADRGATEWCGTLSVEDEDKRSLFESLGFEAAGEGEAFTLGERQVPSVLLKWST